ncbi:MAG: SMC-Scp complex subunit ScpB [Rhodospirillaceae bacterium]|nr:SMC-Scp complex subunit ScpB [Rhodospirillaceae bacterium]
MTDIGHWTRVVEAMLFASAIPLPRDAIAARLPEGVDLDAILSTIETAYAPRGVNLVQVAEGWAMRTAPDLAGDLTRAETVERRLSRAALETLAIVAYHQPVTRAEIEGIRGVAVSKGTLDILFETGWIEPRGRRRTPGRPVTWVTTPAFLDHFGLGSLNELPGVDELRAAGLLDPTIGTWQLGETGGGESEDGDAEDDENDDEFAP